MISQNEIGKFIVVEGIDGSGKSTACKLLGGILEHDFNIQVLLTREPGGTEFSEKCRELLFSHSNLTVETEILLMLAARFQHYHEKILPALKEGKWVICDRWHPSTYVYQMWRTHRLELDWYYKIVSTISMNLTKLAPPPHRPLLRPDMSILMDVDYDTVKQRLAQKHDVNRLDPISPEEYFNLNYGYSYFKDISCGYEVIGNPISNTLDDLKVSLYQFLTQFYDLS